MKHFRVNRIIKDEWGYLVDELAEETEDTVDEIQKALEETKRTNDALTVLLKAIGDEK